MLRVEAHPFTGEVEVDAEALKALSDEERERALEEIARDLLVSGIDYDWQLVEESEEPAR